MKNASEKPADTTMMGVVHDALRRDLARLDTALSHTPPPDGSRGKALAGHAVWMMSFLHHHHLGEDTGLWPVVRCHHPQDSSVIDRMEVAHARLGPQIDDVREAGHHCQVEHSEHALAQLRAALAALTEPLTEHLRIEEDEAMPLVSATITDTEWQAWDHQYNVQGKSLNQLADEAHWLMDGLDPDRYDTLVHLVPAPVRVLIIKGYARRYRRACALRWGPNIDVGPQPTTSTTTTRPGHTKPTSHKSPQPAQPKVVRSHQ